MTPEKKRVVVSFAVLILFISFSFIFFFSVKHGEKTAGAPTLIRKSFLWNEHVWKILSTNKRKSVDLPPPPEGRPPRVNGMLGLKSQLDLKNFKVKVQSGEKVLLLPVDAFKVVPKADYSTLFKCIEGWSEDFQYAGARFSDFMDFYQIGKKPDGSYYSYVGLETPDRKYYVSIDMESMLHDQTVLAYEMNDRPLRPENGAPLRLMIPIKYGIKSLKRIGYIFFSDERPKDYWAERGYDWYSGL
ncbi:MAG: molybdopterin-dependent oxidoreductase [Bacteriovoracia bacterium]